MSNHVPAALLEVYGACAVPSVITNDDFLILWSNAAALQAFPSMRLPDGLRARLTAGEREQIRTRLDENSRYCSLAGAQPFSGYTLILSRLQNGMLLAQLAASNVWGPPGHPEGAGQILTAFGQQFRAPVASIFPALSAISSDMALREDFSLTGPLDSINTACYRMLRSCQNSAFYLRAVHGLAAANPRRVDLATALRQLCSAAAMLLDAEGVELVQSLPRAPLSVLCDLSLVETALLNLLSNSCRFGRGEKENRVTVSLRHAGSQLRLTVSDHGAGIPHRLLERVTEPYFSYDPDGLPVAGAGLGLPVVKLASAALGGTFALTSRPGRGTTAAFTLPLQDDPALPLSAGRKTGDYLSDRFSVLYVLLSDACRCPLP